MRLRWRGLFREQPKTPEDYRQGLIHAGWDARCPTCKTDLSVRHSLFDSHSGVLKVWALCAMGHTNLQFLERTQ